MLNFLNFKHVYLFFELRGNLAESDLSSTTHKEKI